MPLSIAVDFMIVYLALLPTLWTGAAYAAKGKLPKWVSEDCVKKKDNYYFVGYGEGQNSASASRNALISSRQNALTCLFGGTITSSISIREDNKTLEFDSTTDLELDYSFVNWAGYQQVGDRAHALNDSRTKVYIQYQWSSVAISSEKQRLDKMASQIAETKAKEQEIQIQSQVIRRQRQQLETLNRQAQELASLKTESEEAVFRLQQINENRNEKKESIVNVISNLYCGITIEELARIFREPDKIETRGFPYIHDLDVYWMDFIVMVPEEYVRAKLQIEGFEFTPAYFSSNRSRVRRALGSYKIFELRADSALTSKTYKLCE